MTLRASAGAGILRTGLRPLCESTAEFCGYAFDDSDRLAIDDAMLHTDVQEPDGWYDPVR